MNTKTIVDDIAKLPTRISGGINWPKFWKRVLYWLWTVTTKLIVILICEEVVTGGIIYLFPEMGKRLGKIRFFAVLNDFEATYRLTLAHAFVIVPVISTFMLWGLIFEFYLAADRFGERFDRFEVERGKQVILLIGVVVITADAGMFCAAFTMGSWGSSKLTPTTVLATALYVATIAFVSLVSMYLSDNVTAHNPSLEKSN